MKVILLRDQRILHKAGDTVEVSSAVYDFLISTGSAKPVVSKPAESPKVETKAAQAPKRRTTKKG